MLLSRVLTALFLLPLFLAAMFGLSQLGWGALMLVVVSLACAEWTRLVELRGNLRFVFTAAVLGGCLTLAGAGPGTGTLVALGIVLVFWLTLVPAWLCGRAVPSTAGLSLAGILVLASAWYALYELQPTPERLLALMCVVWIADTGAYFAGRTFGRRKLAPRISPGKTWEGVAGAALSVGVYYGVVWWVWSPSALIPTRLLDLLIVLGMTALSIEGDLFESWLKRRAGVKDSGRMLPGHGGILDRIDGVVAALPLAALLSLVTRG